MRLVDQNPRCLPRLAPDLLITVNRTMAITESERQRTDQRVRVVGTSPRRNLGADRREPGNVTPIGLGVLHP